MAQLDQSEILVARRFKSQIIARMAAEKIKDLSDSEITRTLEGCVLGTLLIKMALCLRDNNELLEAEIAS